MDCIFCKIVDQEIPSFRIYEDRRFLAFLDINPINKGHLLVIPKEHYENLGMVPVDLVKDIMPVIKKLSSAVVDGTGAGGFNLVVNNGQAAGQLVNHLHFHIIPRFKDDKLHPWPGRQYQDGEMENYRERLLKALDG